MMFSCFYSFSLVVDSLLTEPVLQHHPYGCSISTVDFSLVLGAKSLIFSRTSVPFSLHADAKQHARNVIESINACWNTTRATVADLLTHIVMISRCHNPNCHHGATNFRTKCSVALQPLYTKSHRLTENQYLLAARWMKVVAHTLQELHTQKCGRTEPTLLDPFCGISSVSILVRAACQEHAEEAAAVVAVVKAVASALDFPLPPQQAALCCSKVSTASCHSRKWKKKRAKSQKKKVKS